MDARCSVQYQVGTLRENGEVAQAGGTKAIVRVGWNAWVFGNKSISIYTPHCLADESEQARAAAEVVKYRLQRQLHSREDALQKKQHEVDDLVAASTREQERWEALGVQQQKSLDTLKHERDEAVASCRQLQDKVFRPSCFHVGQCVAER